MITLAVLTTDYRIESVSHRLALIAIFADHARRTNALARGRLARGGRRTVARLAIRKSEIAGLTGVAPSTDHVGPALALAAVRVALVTQRTVRVAGARERSAVVRGRQRERRLFAKT